MGLAALNGRSLTLAFAPAREACSLRLRGARGKSGGRARRRLGAAPEVLETRVHTRAARA